MKRRTAALLIAMSALSACASVGQSPGEVSPAGKRYGGTASRTLAVPYFDARSAAYGTFHGMSMRLDSVQALTSGEVFAGEREDLRVQIRIERAGAASTRVRIDAWRAILFGDTPVANSVLAHLERRLGIEPEPR